MLHVCRMCFRMHCLQRVVLATGYCYAFDFLDEKALGMSFTNQRYLASHPPIFLAAPAMHRSSGRGVMANR